jgi:hypothetical protein
MDSRPGDRRAFRSRGDQPGTVRLGERPAARDHLVEDRARAVDVAAGVHHLAHQLFRGHVGRRAGHHRVVAQVAGVGPLVPLQPAQRRQAEVEDLQAPVRRDPHVAGLEVAMDDPFAVSGAQPLGELHAQAQDFALGQRRPADLVVQSAALDQLHHQEVRAALVVEVVDGRDVGVVEPREGERLQAEALARGLVRQGARRQHLERHVAVQPFVVGAVDHAHAAGPDHLQDPEMSERLTDHLEAPPC